MSLRPFRYLCFKIVKEEGLGRFFANTILRDVSTLSAYTQVYDIAMLQMTPILYHMHVQTSTDYSNGNLMIRLNGFYAM